MIYYIYISKWHENYISNQLETKFFLYVMKSVSFFLSETFKEINSFFFIFFIILYFEYNIYKIQSHYAFVANFQNIL